MVQTVYRGTWAEIDLACIEHNVVQMKRKLPRHTEMIAVVKADGYGHGSVRVAKKALEAGAKALAVALLEEALVLREASIKAPILVLGWVSPKYVPIASKHDITLTFFQTEWLDEAGRQSLPKPLKLHMKWDTGMGRIGIRTKDELNDVLHQLKKYPSLSLTGIYTHFATADEKDLTFFYEQNERFDDLLQEFKQLWSQPVMIHIGNSAASIRFPQRMHNYIRFGISMYGLYPSKAVQEEDRIELAEAFSLHSQLIHIKKVPAGTTISYGKTFTTEKDEWIGTIPIGYGDGWIRKLQ
ncbi:MAG TPA: alanine racemase, partial [Bacillota bacterium]